MTRFNEAFATEAERDQYLIEEAKKTVISDLHFLAARIGKDEAVKWLNEEFIQVLF